MQLITEVTELLRQVRASQACPPYDPVHGLVRERKAALLPRLAQAIQEAAVIASVNADDRYLQQLVALQAALQALTS